MVLFDVNVLIVLVVVEYVYYDVVVDWFMVFDIGFVICLMI